MASIEINLDDPTDPYIFIATDNGDEVKIWRADNLRNLNLDRDGLVEEIATACIQVEDWEENPPVFIPEEDPAEQSFLQTLIDEAVALKAELGGGDSTGNSLIVTCPGNVLKARGIALFGAARLIWPEPPCQDFVDAVNDRLPVDGPETNSTLILRRDSGGEELLITIPAGSVQFFGSDSDGTGSFSLAWSGTVSNTGALAGEDWNTALFQAE